MNRDGCDNVNSIYNLDPRTPITKRTDGWNLNYFLREGIEYMAMVDYPYPTSFLLSMPGQSVKVACGFMNSSGTSFTDQQLALWIGQDAGIYYNYTAIHVRSPTNKNCTAPPYCIDPDICGDVGTEGLGGSPLGWPWQECSEIVMDMCSEGGNNDFFWDECGTDSIGLMAESCLDTFQSFGWNTKYWDIQAVPKLYGLTMARASNIILTQGHLDPWSGGGFQANSPGADQKRASNLITANDLMQWNTAYFDVRLDHFRYSNTKTFKMKYLYNNTYYHPGGPIFFYTGNEGDIEDFATATGMIWDLASMFNASIIFAEHRFYGVSQPFGNDSYSNSNNNLPMKFDPSTPVIAFGGSYGGMLSAWFRMKYPHVIAGAWASSAPLLYFQGAGVDPGKFDSITTRTYAESGCNNFIVANAWNAILNLSMTRDGCDNVNSIYNLDPRTPITKRTDGWNLNYFLREGIEYMAMVDYPYPTSFLLSMPGQSVKVACGFMNSSGTSFTDQQLALWIGQDAGIYYNYTGTAPPYCIDPDICGDVGTEGLGGSPLGWPWQECSEIVMDMCSEGGNNDFFWDECGTDSIGLMAESCLDTFQSFGWNTKYWDIQAVPKLYGLTMARCSNTPLLRSI